MTTVYLCIGTPKTGTKALQSFMRRNEDVLKTQGYCYPYLDLGIQTHYNNRNAQFLVYHAKNKNNLAAIKQRGYQILEELAKQYQNIVLSEEIIWYYCNQIKDFWVDTVNNFKKINCNVKVVVYLRRQDLLIQSLWNQSVKAYARSVLTFKEYMDSKHYDYFPLDYYTQLQKIAQAVTKDNMIVRVYESGQYEGEEQSIYSDFLKAIGLNLNKHYAKDNLAKNIGLNNNFVEMKRILNGIPEYSGMSDFLARPMVYANLCQTDKELHAQESMFSYDEQITFLKRYEESNRKVAIEFLGREDGVLFKETIKELPEWKIDQNKIYQDVIVFMAEAFCFQQNKILKLEEEIKDLRERDRSMVLRGYEKIKKKMFQK